MGTAMFVLGPVEAGMDADALSRIIQGLAAGIGFLGAGAIVKREHTAEIHGLTTAAGIWMTAALSVVIAMGQIFQGFAGAVLAWIVLALLRRLPIEREESRDPSTTPP